MTKPNSFYRFEKAWNTGFFPDNQIQSDLINELYTYIGSQLSTWVTLGTTTFPALSQIVRNYVNGYNGYPYYGDFNFKAFSLSPTNFNISIVNIGLLAVDGNQAIVITGVMDAITKVISVAPTLAPFAPGSYTGTFESTLINEEEKVQEALEIVYQNGSALFPITYKYDATTMVAKSGLARGSDWMLYNGTEPNRLPLPTAPSTNRRTFNLPVLNGDDQYVVSILERIIQASLEDPDYANSVYPTIISYDAPSGWTRTISNPAYTTYNRVQVVYSDDSGRRKFILVGRLDTDWLWQRFVSDESGSAYNFLTAYIETTPLPYEPNQAGRWLYNDNTFDLEFVEFNSGCYESEEFYPMPTKPGDQLQFNVDKQNANLIGVDSVLVGLFTENGDLLQKVGSVNLDPICCCNQYTFTREYTAEELNDIRLAINSNIGSGGYLYYFWVSSPTEIISYISEELPSEPIDTPQQLNDYFASFSSSEFIFNVNITGEDFESATGSISITTINFNCDEPLLYMNQQVTNEPLNVISSSDFIVTGGCSDLILDQGFASVTIPSKQGCYRLGLYNEPSTTCELEFVYVIDSYSAFLASLEPYEPNYFAIGISNGTEWSSVYGFQITNDIGVNGDAFLATFNVPGEVSAVLDPILDTMTITWNITVPCDGIYNMKGVISDIDFSTIIQGLWQTDQQNCTCGESYYLYSLSNIINIDHSDCYSTIIEFWSDDNTIAEGFEYYNGWKQRIRLGINGGGEKPIIEESLYRQSNGVHKRPQNKQDLSIDLHTDFLDLPTQWALVDATRHPYFVWNGQNIFVKGDIEVATTQDFTTQSSFETLAQVKFQVLKQGFQPKNSSCINC